MAAVHILAAKLEAVALAECGGRIVRIFRGKPAVAVSHTVLDHNRTDLSGSRLRIEIPAVIDVVMGDTSVESVALTTGKLCCKSIRIVPTRITVIIRFTVLDQVVGRPHFLIIGFPGIAGDLKS